MEDAALFPALARTLPIEDAERHLVHRVALGDRQALNSLVSRHQRMLFQYLVQITPNREVAEEILQDTFVAVWQSANTFGGRSSVRTWLIGIARRQAHNTLRRAQLSLAKEDELRDVPATEPEPEASALSTFEREALVEGLTKLSPLHREVLVLTFVHGLSYQEIAEALRVPVGTVRSRLSNAKVALRGHLEPTLAGV